MLAAPRVFVCLCNLVPGDVPQPALLPVVDDVGGILMVSSRLKMKYTHMGGSFSTKAESSPRGTITTHMQMTSRIKPNLESPPARNTPHIQQVFIGGPHTYTTLMAVMIPK